MSLYSPPPPLHTWEQDKPTLLVCWWITLFCTTIIMLRIAGRFVRSEKLFTEDKMAAFAIIPIYLRMGCVHVILIYGTNNNQLPSDLGAEDLRRRRAGSGLVLASRIFYATSLWILKFAILEFFRRLTSTSWQRSFEVTLRFIKCTLVLTFVAIVISDFAECRPFRYYWQVLPDPGGQCRQGYAQLLTMAVCNVITDLLLVFFPIPIIIGSHMTAKKKVQLVLLFSLSLGVVGMTLYRVPHVVWASGSQQLRSLLASVELLFATTAANALVLGSFVRDRGVKKIRYRHNSNADSTDGSLRTRRPTIHRHWGSDEDLVRDLGLGVDHALRSAHAEEGHPTPAPFAKLASDMNSWQFPKRRRSHTELSDDSLLPRDPLLASRSNSTTSRRVSFFDVGGLLDDGPARSISIRDSYNSSIDPLSPRSIPSPISPTNSIPAGTIGFRRGSQALLQDLGGLLGPLSAKTTRSTSSRSSPTTPSGTELQTIPQHPRETPTNAEYHNQNAPIHLDGSTLRE